MSNSPFRSFWQHRIQESLAKRSLCWLQGPRRLGKTTLCRSLAPAGFYNCDLPSVQRDLADPEVFLKSLDPRRGFYVFDEIHQIPDPSRLLKIAADEFPALRIVATGSSTLAATQKFKDALTDRKREVHLTPILCEELASFDRDDLKLRMMRGGLPPSLLAASWDGEFFSEWIDSFYAKDMQELYAIDKRQPFIQLFELLLYQNGGMADVTDFAKKCGISRPTTIKYMEALEQTRVIHVIRPFHGGGEQEIVRQPKVYAFDTGFVCYARGWGELRPEDCGHLLENLTLESLHASVKPRQIHYWRTKQKKEVDFVLKERGVLHAIECKWRWNSFDAEGLKSFRAQHPEGLNLCVTSEGRVEKFQVQGMEILHVPIRQLRQWVDENL